MKIGSGPCNPSTGNDFFGGCFSSSFFFFFFLAGSDVSGWSMYMDNESGQAFYVKESTGETTWEKPNAVGK